MNFKRIVLGGLAAGVVMNVLDFITNFVIFGEAWKAAYDALQLAPSENALAGFWITFDLVAGLLIAWLYAAIRPRFGAGMKTAFIAGAFVWLLVHMPFWSHLVDGIYPMQVVLGTGAMEIVSALVGGSIAGYFYREV